MSFYFPCFLQMQLMICVRGGKFVGRWQCVVVVVVFFCSEYQIVVVFSCSEYHFFFPYIVTCLLFWIWNVLFSQSHITLHFSVFALFQFCYWIIDSVGFMRSGVWSCNHPFFGHNWLHGYVKAGTNTNGFVNVNSSFSFVFFIPTDHTHIFFTHTQKNSASPYKFVICSTSCTQVFGST